MNKVENRMLAKMPEFNVSKLDPFPGEYDKYYSDHFPFRSELVQEFNKFNYNNFRISPLPDKVVIGQNGFLFMSNFQMETFQGRNLFTGDELKSVVKELIYRRDYCLSRGIKFYFVILPQKHTIYSEFIPSRFKPSSVHQTLRVQLEKQLKLKDFDFIDPTDSLIEKKKEKYPLYYKTDNHWNNLGAFYGAQVILKRINEDFPQVRIPKISDYLVSEINSASGNLAQMLNLQNDLSEDKVILDPIEPTTAKTGEKVPYTPTEGFAYTDEYEMVFKNPEANELKALFIRESFANSQKEFYANAFGKTVLIWDRWQYALNESIIENEKPDIVVIQILESNLPKLLNNQSHK